MPAEKQMLSNQYGKLLFSVVYRNAPEDFDLCVKAARQRMSTLEKTKHFLLPRLGLYFGFFTVFYQPPFKLTTSGWQLQSPLSLLILITTIALFERLAGPRIRSRAQWRKASKSPLFFHLHGYENGFTIIKDCADIGSMSAEEVQKITVVSDYWSSLAGFKRTPENLFLFTPKRRVFLISNRDFSGTDSFESVCNQVQSIFKIPETNVPPIASPR